MEIEPMLQKIIKPSSNKTRNVQHPGIKIYKIDMPSIQWRKRRTTNEKNNKTNGSKNRGRFMPV